MKNQPPVTKYERLSYLLAQYGNGALTEQQFWGAMIVCGYGQDDIDAWCAEYHGKQEARQ